MMRILLALAFLLLAQAFLVSATIPEEVYQKIEMIQNPTELRALEGIPEMFLQEKAYSAKDIGDLILQLQNDRATFAKEVATSPLDQLITTLKSMLADEERQNLYARLVPQIRFQWVRTRDWIFLSTITINPQPYDERKPSVLVRTPYGPTSSNLADLYLLDGFVAVLQDQRGAFLSSGFWDFWRSDSADAYDTMEWIAKQKWSNGRVYTAGISADGCSALTQPLFHPPWLKGQFIVWGSPEAYDSTYQGGAYRQSLIERWLTFIGITTRLHSWTVIDDVLAHESKDSYWDTLSLRDNDAYPNVDFPSVHYAGWYDIFQGPNIDAFNAYQYQSSSQGQHILYVDAGGHCVGSGDASFPHSFTTLPFKLSRDLFKSIEFGTSFNTTHKLILYILGTAFKDSQISSDVGNYWTTLPDWPKTSPTPFYLNVADSLTSFPPTQTGAFASFLYDPENPIRTPGGNNLAPPCGVHDLADVEQRDDVIVFTSDYLWEPVAVVGRIQAILYVSSNVIDTDFAAFLSDVNPDNSSALVQDGIIRMRWREGSVTPIYMETGVIYKVTVDLWYMAQVFNAGHRIRLSISSSNHPRFSVNRNNGRMVEDEGPYVQAINTIHFSPLHPSHLLLPVVRVADIPENPEIKKLYAVEPQL